MLFRSETLKFTFFCYGAIDMWVMETNLVSEFGNIRKLIEVKILISVAHFKFFSGLVESGFSVSDEM